MDEDVEDECGEEEFASKMDGDSNHLVGYLCNYEVYKRMKDIKDKGQATPLEWKITRHPDAPISKSTSLMPTLIYEGLQYLSSTPCTTQSEEAVYEFVKKMEPFKLTKPEKLCILNTRPTKPLDIQAIVEESEERLSEEQIDDILKIVEEVLPIPQTQGQATSSSTGTLPPATTTGSS